MEYINCCIYHFLAGIKHIAVAMILSMSIPAPNIANSGKPVNAIRKLSNNQSRVETRQTSQSYSPTNICHTRKQPKPNATASIMIPPLDLGTYSLTVACNVVLEVMEDITECCFTLSN